MKRTQQGVAVITALLIVTMATLAVTGMLWRQQVQLRAVENRLALAQARALAYAALDWAGLVLWEDQNLPGRAAYDHPNEPWGVALAETRVTDATGGDAREAYVSGRITDESGKLNVFDLAYGGVIDDTARAQFERLADALQLDKAWVIALADAVLQTQAQPAPQTGGRAPAPRQLPLLTWDDAATRAGLDDTTRSRLRAHVALLPKQNNETLTSINANSATAEVLYARIDALSLAQAQALAQARDRVELRNTGDIETVTRMTGLTEKLRAVDVKSEYFRMDGRVRYDRALLAVQALVWRAPTGQDKPHLLWLREL